MASAVPVLFRRLSFSRRVVLCGFLLPLAMDVRKIGDGGDSYMQIVLLAVALIGAGIYLSLEFLSMAARRRSSPLVRVSILWWAYILVSIVPVVYWSVELEHYLKVLLPFVLFGIGLTVMLAVERRNVDPAEILDILIWGALISTIWRAIYATAIGGLSIETMRWQILGPAIPYAIGYGAAGLYLGRRRKLAATALVVGGLCVILSITRAYLITAFFVAAGLFFIDVRRRSMARAVSASLRLAMRVSPMIAVALALAIAVRPDFATAWFGRLFEHSTSSGLDITFVTRIAEYVGQYDALTRSSTTLLMGNGIGADYSSDIGLLNSLGFDVSESVAWFAGHSTWLYSFFASGLAIGAVVPFVLFVPLFRGLSLTSTRRLAHATDDAVTACAIYFAYLGQSFTSNLLNERYGAMILGIVAGSILVFVGRRREMGIRVSYLVHPSVSNMRLSVPAPNGAPSQ